VSFIHNSEPSYRSDRLQHASAFQRSKANVGMPITFRWAPATGVRDRQVRRREVLPPIIRSDNPYGCSAGRLRQGWR
jgi:hypothetical protein